MESIVECGAMLISVSSWAAKLVLGLYEGQCPVFIVGHFHYKAMWLVLDYFSHTPKAEGWLITTIGDIHFMVSRLLVFCWVKVSQGIRGVPLLLSELSYKLWESFSARRHLAVLLFMSREIRLF